MRLHLHANLAVVALIVLLLPACYDPAGYCVSSRNTAHAIPVLAADTWTDVSVTGPVLATLPRSITEDSDDGYAVDNLAYEPIGINATPAVYTLGHHPQSVAFDEPLNKLRADSDIRRGSMRVSF